MIRNSLWTLIFALLASLAEPNSLARGDGLAWPAARPLQRSSAGAGRVLPLAPGPIARHTANPMVDHSAWYGHTMGVPTYRWGYFGVKARPYGVKLGSYYGDHAGWSLHRGY